MNKTSKAASIMGQAKSEEKAAAARANGQLGGRPRKDGQPAASKTALRVWVLYKTAMGDGFYSIRAYVVRGSKKAAMAQACAENIVDGYAPVAVLEVEKAGDWEASPFKARLLSPAFTGCLCKLSGRHVRVERAAIDSAWLDK